MALHGHGDEPGSAREWARGIAPAGWEVLAPGAARDRDGVRSWFATGPRGVPASELAAAVRRVADLVDRVRGSGRPVAVAGFSQGGAVALALGPHGVRPDAVVAMCTFLPEVDGDVGRIGPGGDPSLGDATAARDAVAVDDRAPVLVLGTRDDDDVPPFLGEDAAAHLRAQGYAVESDVLDGGHRVSDAVQRRAAAWLADAVRRGPKISLGLPCDRVTAGAELVSAAAVAELASWYERLGFDALYVTDHPAPDDRWLAAGGHHALEPAAVLAAAAASTSRIRLHTNVYVLGYRNPFLAAKALASVDVLSDGRLIVGVAAGYLRPEFDALGASFDDRADRLDEALELLPRVWRGETVAAEGAGWRARGVTALPTPVQRPHPPIWVGGNSVAAMRRAVRFGQGWSPFPTSPGGAEALRTAAISDVATLQRRLARLGELCDEAGRTDRPGVCFVPFGLAEYLADPDGRLGPLCEEVEQLHGLGVDWLALMVPGTTRAEVRDRAEELAAAVLR